MMGHEEVLQYFEEELFYYLNSDKYEVLSVHYDSMRMQPIRHSLCEVYDDRERLKWHHTGTFAGVDIFDSLTKDHDKPYQIIREQIYHECNKCSAIEMYDESCNTYYCPYCDNRRARFKDKIYNLLG